MAGATLLTLLDDIATVLDDVAVMTKKAATKTAGVLGDDLALNAQQVTGVRANRELPVVWAVARGSALNKLILVPAAMLISLLLPWAITPLLMLGGAFLCYEGAEKVWHMIAHRQDRPEDHAEHIAALADPAKDIVALEKQKIRGAIRTDFILSAEIIVIALGTVAAAPIMQRAMVLIAIATLMTVGVYGLVAAIVRLDDWGLQLQERSGAAAQALGRALLAFAPRLMKFLSIAGTTAMFLVGGGILIHGIAPLHHALGRLAEIEAGGAVSAALILAAPVANLLTGLVAGAIAVLLMKLGTRLRGAGPH